MAPRTFDLINVEQELYELPHKVYPSLSIQGYFILTSMSLGTRHLQQRSANDFCGDRAFTRL